MELDCRLCRDVQMMLIKRGYSELDDDGGLTDRPGSFPSASGRITWDTFPQLATNALVFLVEDVALSHSAWRSSMFPRNILLNLY